MDTPVSSPATADCADSGPQSALERKFIEEYLVRNGTSLEDIHTLPAEESKALMKVACRYASLRLAEIESRSHLRATIHIQD